MIVNIAAYHFAPLTNLPRLREDVRAVAREQQLLGTVLLSTEGINLFLAGERAGIDTFLNHVRQVPGLQDLIAKESLSSDRPFHRLLVKIKQEIIPFGIEGIDPRERPAPRVSAQQLKSWLDQGEPVLLLDTRNDFEVQTGTFDGAIPIGIKDFRHFPEAVSQLPDDWKSRPIVTFCTGGIRCEKAAPYLIREGFQQVYQLDGGILKYFEECGGDHYHGDCFVFDQRVALTPSLEPARYKQCFACQSVLSLQDQESPQYIEGVSCPHCWREDSPLEPVTISKRQVALHFLTHPLPGSKPYDLDRPISVPGRLDGFEVLDFLDAMKTHLSREEWRSACLNGDLRRRDEVILPGTIVRGGDRLWHRVSGVTEPDVSSDIQVLHEDETLVVVHKPAPLPMHPCGRFQRNTLTWMLERVFEPAVLRPAHRLDAETAGLVLFCKTRSAAREVQQQFAAGTVEKRYLARVWGHPPADAFVCDRPISPEPTVAGTRVIDDADGQPASTRFTVQERLPDGTSLLEVQPLTGRTHQIRLHLQSLGWPIVGDPVYGRPGDSSSPMNLLAWQITFRHPTHGARVKFETELPGWAAGLPLAPQ